VTRARAEQYRRLAEECLAAIRRADELRAKAAQCLALSRSTTDRQTRTALLIMAQKLHDMANDRPGNFEMAQREFNDQQMLPQRLKPRPAMQQQQIRPKKEE
jgi:hypothetical protein